MGCVTSKPSSSGAATAVASAPPAVITTSTPLNKISPRHSEESNGGTDDNEAVVVRVATYSTTSSSTTSSAPCSRTGTCTIGTTTRVRYAALSQQGRDPEAPHKPNQDRFDVQEGLGEETAFFAAVYDGHGPRGDQCSQYVRDHLPALITRHMTKHSTTINNDDGDDEHIEGSLVRAHAECNDGLHAHPDIDDGYSGTTAVSIFLHGDGHAITVANVGDSRCILGTAKINPQQEEQRLAFPLSQDQTPHRPEEAERCIQAGARILSFGQIDPSKRDDEVEDPPRVWAPSGNFPGTAFTRSIGDAFAETLGVCAEPELLTLQLSTKEKILVLGSDGVFDVLSNQQVMDLCWQHYPLEPEQACRAVLDKSRTAWLIQELGGEHLDDSTKANFDDMTVICVFLQHDDDSAPTTSSATTDLRKTLSSIQPHHERQPSKRRIRQKTLNNLEEMPSEAPTDQQQSIPS